MVSLVAQQAGFDNCISSASSTGVYRSVGQFSCQFVWQALRATVAANTVPSPASRRLSSNVLDMRRPAPCLLEFETKRDDHQDRKTTEAARSPDPTARARSDRSNGRPRTPSAQVVYGSNPPTTRVRLRVSSLSCVAARILTSTARPRWVAITDRRPVFAEPRRPRAATALSPARRCGNVDWNERRPAAANGRGGLVRTIA